MIEFATKLLKLVEFFKAIPAIVRHPEYNSLRSTLLAFSLGIGFWAVILAYSLGIKPLSVGGIGTAIAAVYIILLFAFTQWHQRVSSLPATGNVIQVEELPAQGLPFPPEELIHAFLKRECVLFAGTGVSAQAGYPTWRTFADDLLKTAVKHELVPASSEPALRSLLNQRQYNLVVDAITNAEEGRKAALRILRAAYGEHSSRDSELNVALRELPFAGALITGFDERLENALIGRSGVDKVLGRTDGEKLLQSLSSRKYFIHRPFGTLKEPSQIAWTVAGLADFIATDRQYGQFLEALVFSNTLLFVGVSLRGIEEFMERIPGRSGVGRTHFALVSVSDAAWQEKANHLERRFNVRVLPYTRHAHQEVPRFAQKLSNEVWAKLKGAFKDAQTKLTAPLRSITLENIGPFDRLSLALDANWNILLGDNGVGKSSILKAIAIAICGEEVRQLAAYLLKAGRSQASIILETQEGMQYTTNIYRRGISVEVVSLPRRPLDVESWLSVGFSPVRTISKKTAESGTRGIPRPVAEDLMPLILGEPDPRLDKLKGWIGDLYSAAHNEKLLPSVKAKYRAVLDQFFKIIEDVTPGLTIKMASFDPETRQILISTDDGVVPLEVVSQGTISLLGWVGVFLQRMYDLQDDSKSGESEVSNSEAQNASLWVSTSPRKMLVLIDEIDAHMHPKWQHSLIATLQKMFPNVQFIATTHSPLIVSGLKPYQVILCRRNEEGQAIAEKRTAPTKGQFADEMLTGPYFGMPSTLDKDSERFLKLKARKLSGAKLGKDEEEEYIELKKELGRSEIALGPEMQERAYQEIMKILADKLQAQEPHFKDRVLEEARLILADGYTKKNV